MIELRQLRYFVAVAETLHFGRAAHRLHLTQPPLSRQIAALERDLGVRLLERHSRQALLTHAGRRFLEDARAVLATFDQACRNARLTAGGEKGEVTIGFMMHAAYGIVPGLARRFMAEHPEVELKLREVVPGTLGEEIAAGRVDAGIMFDAALARGLRRHPVHREQLCLVMPSDHALAATEPVPAGCLEQEAFIATPTETAPALREAILAFCRRAGFAPRIRLEVQLQQTILSLVAEGLGLAIVPYSMRRLGMPDLVFRELSAAPEIEQVLAWREDNLNPALTTFLVTAGVPLDDGSSRS